MKWIAFFPFVNICRATRNVLASLRLPIAEWMLSFMAAEINQMKIEIVHPFRSRRAQRSVAKQTVDCHAVVSALHWEEIDLLESALFVSAEQFSCASESEAKDAEGKGWKETMFAFDAAKSVSVALMRNVRCSASSDFMFGVSFSLPLKFPEPSWTSFCTEIAHYFRPCRANGLLTTTRRTLFFVIQWTRSRQNRMEE